MTDYEKVRAEERPLLVVDVCGCECEIVETDDAILFYADGHFVGELFEEESAEDYISQIEEILD